MRSAQNAKAPCFDFQRRLYCDLIFPRLQAHRNTFQVLPTDCPSRHGDNTRDITFCPAVPGLKSLGREPRHMQALSEFDLLCAVREYFGPSSPSVQTRPLQLTRVLDHEHSKFAPHASPEDVTRVPCMHDRAEGLVVEMSTQHVRTEFHANVVDHSKPCAEHANDDPVDVPFQERCEGLEENRHSAHTEHEKTQKFEDRVEPLYLAQGVAGRKNEVQFRKSALEDQTLVPLEDACPGMRQVAHAIERL